MFGLSTPFLIIVALLIIFRVAFSIYVWYNRKRLENRVKEILD